MRFIIEANDTTDRYWMNDEVHKLWLTDVMKDFMKLDVISVKVIRKDNEQPDK